MCTYVHVVKHLKNEYICTFIVQVKIRMCTYVHVVKHLKNEDYTTYVHISQFTWCRVMSTIIVFITRRHLSAAQASSSFKWLNTCTSTPTMLIFKTEVLCPDT